MAEVWHAMVTDTREVASRPGVGTHSQKRHPMRMNYFIARDLHAP